MTRSGRSPGYAGASRAKARRMQEGGTTYPSPDPSEPREILEYARARRENAPRAWDVPREQWHNLGQGPTPQNLKNFEYEREIGVRKASGGRITYAQRKALPSSKFALPGKGEGAGGKGPGSYPIDTPARARNALARGAQHASPGELATIKRKVKARYPSIKVGGD